MRLIRDYLSEATIVVSAAKGLEVGSGLRPSQVMAGETPPRLHSQLCALSGPNLAKEIMQGFPAASVVAAPEARTARRAKSLLDTPVFRVSSSTDVVGVEMGGALKNIMALAAGMAEGLGYGDNAKAAIMTRGLAEMMALGVAAGARRQTFLGLSGVGDLVVTCSSPLSRNHHVGLELAKGRSLAEVMDSMREVAEGVATTQAARLLANKLQVKVPITEAIYKVLFEGSHPRQAVAELLGFPLDRL